MELPDNAGLGVIVERYARLLCRVREDVGARPFVLPNASFFPDRFVGDAASLETLTRRMMAHAGLDDVPLTTTVVEEKEPEAPHGGCNSGCAVPGAVAGSVPRLVDDGDEWTLNVPAYELSHPVVLTTMVARALGHVLLVETLSPGERVEAPADVTADYAAVALGFGALLLEGAHIYSKGCGGPQVAAVTSASIQELSVLTALFLRMGDHSPRKALSELGATQAALLGEALEWAKSNPALVDKLRSEPARVAALDYKFSETKPWLFRLFAKSDDAAAPKRAPAKAAAPAPDPDRDELRALVDEALEAVRADAE